MGGRACGLTGRRSNCVVVSIGSNNQWGFEEASLITRRAAGLCPLMLGGRLYPAAVCDLAIGRRRGCVFLAAVDAFWLILLVALGTPGGCTPVVFLTDLSGT